MPRKNAAAVALGKLGAAKGGRARAQKLSPEARSASALKAALARHGKASLAAGAVPGDDYTIETATFALRVTNAGSIVIAREYLNCRPAGLGKVRRIEFDVSLLEGAPAAPAPKVCMLTPPPKGSVTTSTVIGSKLIHRVDLSGEWTEPVSLRFDGELLGAVSSDPPKRKAPAGQWWDGAVCYWVKHRTARLVVSVEWDEGSTRPVKFLSPVVWRGEPPLTTAMQRATEEEACQGMALNARPNAATLTVTGALPGYTFALPWLMEAR